MRKIISIILVLALAVSLCACGKKSSKTETEPEDTQETVQTAETTGTEALPEADATQPEEQTEESIDPDFVAQALAGSYTAMIYGVFPMDMSLYPDFTGYFVPLYAEDGELIKPSEYKLGDDRNLYLTVDGETYVGSYDLTAGVIILQYGDEQLVYNRTSDDYEALYASFAEILAQDELGDDNDEPILYACALENINIRSGAGTEYEKIDKLAEGTVTEIFQKTEKGSYTWYRIGEGRWVADDGTWLSVCDASEYTEGYFDAPEEEETAEEPAETPDDGTAVATETPADGTATTETPATPAEGAAGTIVPYVPVVYEGSDLAALEAVKNTISWLSQFESIYPPSHRDTAYYWDWEVKKVNESTWSVGLLHSEDTAIRYEYTCTVTYDGTNYNVTDVNDVWAQQH